MSCKCVTRRSPHCRYRKTSVACREKASQRVHDSVNAETNVQPQAPTSSVLVMLKASSSDMITGYAAGQVRR